MEPEKTASQEAIEVTPEMIRAGEMEFASYNRDEELDSMIVERIYRAMARLRPKNEA